MPLLLLLVLVLLRHLLVLAFLLLVFLLMWVIGNLKGYWSHAGALSGYLHWRRWPLVCLRSSAAYTHYFSCLEELLRFDA